MQNDFKACIGDFVLGTQTEGELIGNWQKILDTCKKYSLILSEK